jgi:hypothetical protein
MKTIIDNNQRIFHLRRNGYFSRNYFCNLSGLPEIIQTELEKHDEFEVYEFWNDKFKKVGKKRLNELFTANQINFKI